jgi:lipid-binding SYLF domain-containing protein
MASGRQAGRPLRRSDGKLADMRDLGTGTPRVLPPREETDMKPTIRCCAGLMLAGVLAANPGLAADNQSVSRNVGTAGSTGGKLVGSEQLAEAQNIVGEATNVVQQMQKDSALAKLMQKAKGLYIVPQFGRAGLIVGGRGGAGVVVAREAGRWSSPAFFDMGAISVGAQAGASGGSIAFLLMTDNALNSFKSENSFSLNAGAGLSIINYSANAQASWGKGDIILWSNTEGLYAGATVSVSDINWDDDSNAAFYGRPDIKPGDLLSGTITSQRANGLQVALTD